MGPLPVKRGLNPTRILVPPATDTPWVAKDFLWHLISSQRHRAEDDNFSAVLERFTAGEVCLDSGEPLAPDDVLRPGSFINFYRYPAPERPVPGEITVLYQDADIVVVDKPPFLATLPRGQHITETALVKARVQLGIPELSPSHRLDRLTRGVLLMTARPEVRGAYQTMFERRIPHKVYEALTPLPAEAPFAPISPLADWRSWDPPTPERPWRLEHSMSKTRGHLSTILTDGPPNALTLVTGLRTEYRDGREVLVWRLEPRTGKTHQLRVVLRSLGLPILNDPLYTDLTDAALFSIDAPTPRPVYVEDEDFAAPMGLIAKELRFPDPLSGQEREFISRY